MKKLKKFFRILKRFFTQKKYNIMYYYRCYEKEKIDDKTILLCSQQGQTIDGNIFYILKELQKDTYKDYKIYVAYDKKYKNEFIAKFSNYNFYNYKLVDITSKTYFKALATAKYLFNDTSFLWYFVKKEGQIYFNTWHGTPFKTLGRSIKDDFHLIGNVQRNFLMCDYLLYPSKYMMDIMLDDYMLKNISINTKVVLGGYPRNEIFFDKERAKELKKELNLENKQIIVYMPTWRGSFGKLGVTMADQVEIINNYLKHIDKKLTKNQIMFVNFHPFLKDKVNIKGFKHIMPFNKNYETYDFLNMADTLITDYSSVFFDYAVTNKKIILFAYDEKEYFEDRGTYFDFNELPFKKVKNVNELINAINDDTNVDTSKFINKFCPYENNNSSFKIVDFVLNNKKSDLEILDIPNNKKKNILIFAGNLQKNGITSALLSLLNNLDKDKFNYYLTFTNRSVGANKYVLKNLDNRISYIGSYDNKIGTFKEVLILVLYMFKLISYKKSSKYLESYYKREIKRRYYNANFSYAVQYNGYGNNIIRMFSYFPYGKCIFVHSDMSKEAKTRSNQNLETLQNVYNIYDKVIVVSEGLLKPTASIKGNYDNIVVMNNIIDYKTILEKKDKEIAFDDNTESNVSINKLKKILNSKAKKIVAVGRFSKEKGFDRLIDAFLEIDSDMYLIIIGGFGPLYNDLLNKAMTSSKKDRIILIKSLQNPFPIMSKCDCFVMSSLYEGFSLVIFEANVLKIPVVSVSIPAINKFSSDYKGAYITENSTNGIKKGINYFLQNKIALFNINYETFNRESIDKMEKIIDNK